MSVLSLSIIGIAVVLFLLFLGCPIFISLGVAGALGIFLGSGFGAFGLLATRIFASVSSFTLVAAPLFMLMGEIIFRSGIGADLFEFMDRLLYRVPGGIAISSIIALAIFGAMCGVSIAAVAAIGVMALPEMLKRNYDPGLAAGAVCAPGALSMLIPPSLLFILYGEVAGVSVGKLFAAGLMPGILFAVLMCGYIVVRVKMKPALAPRVEQTLTWKQRLEPAKRLWAPIVMIVAVLGSIYGGICTPTESAAIGVVVAYIITLAYGRLSWQTFRGTLIATARVVGAIIIIFAGAVIFTQFMNLVRMPDSFTQLMMSLNVPSWSIIIIIQIILLVLGCFIDGASMVLICTPLFWTTVQSMGWDPIWFGVLMIANINIAVITPPVGLNLYTLGSVTTDVDIATIMKGTLPYVILEFIGLIILIIFPQISLWLPGHMK
jgi:TRAP transporter, DctM subunit